MYRQYRKAGTLHKAFVHREQCYSGHRAIQCDSMSDNAEFVRRVYALLNGRDVESVLAAMHPEVIWANGMEGGHVHGRDEVRSYWQRRWAIIDPYVEPLEILPNGEGEVVVKVHQVMRDLNGKLRAERLVTHVFQTRNGLILRFDIRDV